MGNVIRITPCMVVDDVDAAMRFFVDVLGFTASIHGPGTYAYVEREAAAIRIIKASTSPGEIPGPGSGSFRYYIDVEDMDALVAEIKPKIEAMWVDEKLGRKVYGPVNQRYGQREFMVTAPDGDLVVFGEETTR